MSEGKSIPMKMAKADDDDIGYVIAMCNCIEEYMDYGTCAADGDDEDSQHATPEEFTRRLRELWGERYGPCKADAAWRRVVFGFHTLRDNCCDPESDVLEWKPEILAAVKGGAK